MTHLKQQTKNADQGVRYPTIVDQGSSLETVQTMMANPLVLTNHTTQAEPFHQQQSPVCLAPHLTGKPPATVTY